MPSSAARPLVSVVIAARNAERYIEQAVTSMLVQTWRELEVVVSDDGSTDRTPDIVANIRDSRLRLLRHDAHIGLWAATNAGINASSGPLVARIDADDYALPTRLAEQVAYLQAHPDVALLAGPAHVVTDAGRSPGATPIFHGRALHWMLHTSCVIVHPTVTLRREALPPGGYPMGALYCEDYAVFLDVLRRARLEMTDLPVGMYRRHAQAIGHAQRPVQSLSSAAVLQAHYARAHGVHVKVSTALSWQRPIDAATAEDPAEVARLAKALDPERLAHGPHVPAWTPAELARCRRIYAKQLARIVWFGRSRPDVVRHLGPLAARAAVAAARQGLAR